MYKSKITNVQDLREFLVGLNSDVKVHIVGSEIDDSLSLMTNGKEIVAYTGSMDLDMVDWEEFFEV